MECYRDKEDTRTLKYINEERYDAVKVQPRLVWAEKREKQGEHCVASVDPLDGHPLWLLARTAQLLDEFVVRGLHVVVDEHRVEHVPVLTLETRALLNRLAQVLLLHKAI